MYSCRSFVYKSSADYYSNKSNVCLHFGFLDNLTRHAISKRWSTQTAQLTKLLPLSIARKLMSLFILFNCHMLVNPEYTGFMYLCNAMSIIIYSLWQKFTSTLHFFFHLFHSHADTSVCQYDMVTMIGMFHQCDQSHHENIFFMDQSYLGTRKWSAVLDRSIRLGRREETQLHSGFVKKSFGLQS